MTPVGPATHVLRHDLDLRGTPTEVLRRLRGRPHLVALVGRGWLGGTVVAWGGIADLEDPFTGLDTGTPESLQEPFAGGWIGVWGHRLATQGQAFASHQDRPAPSAAHHVRYYDVVLRQHGDRWWLEQLGGLFPPDRTARRAADFLAAVSVDDAPRPVTVGAFDLTPTAEGHRRSVARAVEHIHAGEVFQVNVTARLEGRFTGDALDVFCAGVERLAPAYAAFVSHPDGAVASLSPELFLRRTGATVLTSPIKGTAPLSTDPALLSASAKDRAENVMIVDLMRNDLGRVAVPGGVRVPDLLRLERHAVWHLVSDVTATLRPGCSHADLLRATFPPGSVTGAPKIRAVELLAELEPTAREAYTGAIGRVGPGGHLELNVAIRTFETAGDRIWLGVGGGIVADSDPQRELEECLHKAGPLLEAIGGSLAPALLAEHSPAPSPPPSVRLPVAPHRADPARGVFETLLVVDGEVRHLADHLTRMAASCRAVWGLVPPGDVAGRLAAAVAGLGSPGRHRLRVSVVPTDGGLRVEELVTSALAESADSATGLRLAPLDTRGGWGPHKWADRPDLPPPDGCDQWLLTDGSSVLETERDSVFAVLDDEVVTPSLDGRLLPGTTRARLLSLLAAGRLPVTERPLDLAGLATASEVFAANALRGVRPVHEVVGVGQWASGPVTSWLVRHVHDEIDAPELPVLPERSAGGTVDRREDDRHGAGRRGSRAPLAAPVRVLVVDNYDSFVYSLVQDLTRSGAEVEVIRNDECTVAELVRARSTGAFTHLLVSPGPGTPGDAGISVALVRTLGPTTPTLGVCLGHQAIVEAFGGRVVRGDRPVHGRTAMVFHDGLGVYRGLPDPFAAARYHSLVAEEATLPDELTVTARTSGGTVMGVRHRRLPVEGVQWHPESVLTSGGRDVVRTFLELPAGAGTDDSTNVLLRP